FLGWLTQDGELLTEEAEAWDNLSVQALWAAQEEPGEEETEEEELPYSDVKKGKWYYEYVYDLSRRGVINGFTDGTFRPAETVSYGQALKLILLSAGYAEQPAEEGSHWASGYLAYAEKKGFVEEGVILDLDMEISREEIAELAAAALELDTWNTGNTPFADTNSGAVLALYREGIVEGSFENGLRLFKGSDFINRAEMSAIVWRIADYVDRTLILFNGYRIPIDYDLRFNPYDQDSFYTEDGRVYYDDDDYDVRYGIDVSFYQKDIDWEAVANDGIDYVIIRAGYRGCSEGELFTDERFYEYIDGATAAGLDVGLYFFSQALNPEEAVEEAEYLLSLIDGYEISYPIAFDWEPLGYSYSRTKDYDYSVLTDCALAFCETIEEAGYLSMVYLNPSFAYLRYDLSRLQGETIWLANYTERTDYYYDFQMWQYGSSGQVDGIEGRVDMNISFYNFARMER
ncbi:MAG: GH25 family lysozyme, partial [Oscillospiraceae bacterium]